MLGAAGNNDTRTFHVLSANQTLVSKDWNTQIHRQVTTDTGTYRGLVGIEGRVWRRPGWNWDGTTSTARRSARRS